MDGVLLMGRSLGWKGFILIIYTVYIYIYIYIIIRLGFMFCMICMSQQISGLGGRTVKCLLMRLSTLLQQNSTTNSTTVETHCSLLQ